MTETVTETVAETTTSSSLVDTSTPVIDFSTGKPEGFPDEFWDGEKNAPLTDKLYTSWQNEKKRAEGLRVKLSKGEFEGKAPEDLSEYKLAFTEEDKIEIPDDDRLLTKARQAAKEAGLPADAFAKFVTPIVKEMEALRAEAIREPTEDEINSAKQAEIAKLGPTGNKITEAVGTWMVELKSTGVFSDSDFEALKSVLTTADAVRAVNKLRMMNASRDSVPLDVPIDNKASAVDIQRKLADAIIKGDEHAASKYSAMLNK